MGRIAIDEIMNSTFEVSLHELIALQKQVIPERGRHLKHCQGAPLSRSRVRGRGMDFQETRHYCPGDDIRLMDWRVTARTQKPHVKVFQEERERPVMVFLDLAPTMFFGTKTSLKSVIAAKLAALLAWSAIAQGDRVGGLLSSIIAQSLYLPHAHHQSLIQFLKSVSQYTSHYQDPKWVEYDRTAATPLFLHRLAQFMRILKPGSLILIISDWYYDPVLVKPYLHELRLHHDIQLYHVFDPIELQAPKEGIYPISNGAEILALNLQSVREQKAYQAFCDARIEAIQGMAKKVLLPYQICSVDTDLAMLARKSLLGRRGG